MGAATRGGVAGFVALGVSLLALSLPAGASASSCEDEFTGPSGGSWSEAADWSAGVPVSSSVVCWDTAKTVLVADGTQSAGSIAAGGGLVVQDGARLDVLGAGPEPSSLSGTVQADAGGVLELHGRLACAAAVAGGGSIEDDGALECPLTVGGGGTLTGVGSVTSVLNEAGVVEPGDGAAPGGLDAGSYSQGASGTLRVRQEGADGGLSDHLLRVAGAVTLGGTISLVPASPPAGFLVLVSASEPQGYFSRVTAPAPGSPWTVAYGAHGAIAISGGSVPVAPVISGPLQAGGAVTCGLAAALWAPRGEVAYDWSGPIFPPIAVLQARTSVPFPGLRSGFLAEQLDAELDAAKGPVISVPAAAVGFPIGCSVRYWTPAGGTQSSVTAAGESAPAAIAGPYRSVHAPAIAGRAVPGSRLACSPGRWEGTPSAITYAWMWSRAGDTEARRWLGTGAGAGHTVTEAEGGGTLACIVTAHYGAIAVPAEASVEVPRRPQPTLCAERALTLVSGRTAAGGVLIFGAATQRHFGQRVVLFHRAGRDRVWRRVASGRVNGSGYFELWVRTGSGGIARGSFRAAIGRTVSNVLHLPGLLQIVAERSSPGISLISLRLAPAARVGARVTVSALERECAAGPAIVSARLGPGADLRLRLTAGGGTGAGYYLARATAGGRTDTIELIVPALPVPLPG